MHWVEGVEKDHNGYHEGGLSAGNFVPADGEAFEGISMLYMTGNDGSLFFSSTSVDASSQSKRVSALFGSGTGSLRRE